MTPLEKAAARYRDAVREERKAVKLFDATIPVTSLSAARLSVAQSRLRDAVDNLLLTALNEDK